MIRLEFRDYLFDVISVHVLECDDINHAVDYAEWIYSNFSEVEHCLYTTDLYYGCIIR